MNDLERDEGRGAEGTEIEEEDPKSQSDCIL